jgi:tripartite-type tricarboxylate transporter receptor subunit TctC
MRRRDLLISAGLPALAPLAAWAAEDTSAYPTKVLTIVVPYAPGGSSDVRARMVAQKLQTYFGKPVIVENKAGAGGDIGTDFVAKAPPDGYTIGVGNFAPMAVNRWLLAKMPFDPQKDLVPVAMLERGPTVLVVRAASPYKTLKDLLDDAKAHPGKLSFASAGTGGAYHLAGEMFKESAGIYATHIPYRGGGPATTDLLSGTVDYMFDWITASLPHIKAGKMRALAICTEKRSPQLPDVPTFAEYGLKNMVVSNWFGIVAPKGTPQAIVTKLNQAINRALSEPDLKERITSQGNEIGQGPPELFQAFVAAESARWGKLIREKHIKPE